MPTLRALLLTDVVDSTQLTEQLGDAATAALWVLHDRIARDLLPRWRGREIDKTDGMLLLFDDVRDAVGYALAYHHALAAHELPFKARAGIHVGPVSLRPNPPDDVARGAKPVEVHGIALPIAARVMSVALGAQTLLSADARLALGVVPQRVMSHGHWRLHGVAEPVELFEVGEPGAAPFTAPPDGTKVYRVMREGDLWQPVREVRHSVPAERDSFVGRQQPLQSLAQKFDADARLVSVLGMGGTGKTRLVTRFAWTWLGDYPGGIWFCDLSQARTLDGIHFAVAQGLDVPLGKTDPVVQLAHAIAGRGRCLVILDNFEQVARFAEATLGRWLDRAPLARFLVTTREVLGIVGEETLALDPLPADDAAALFLRRAQAARQGYTPSADDVSAVRQLVAVLDGLPLAIELAAARVRMMAPRVLLARMHERFDVLRSRAGRHDRQATLRAAFDWSWELLSEPERAALAQLSVFEGGFTLESAEAVLDLSGVGADPPPAADVTQWLIDKSFVRPLASGRFDLLESVREYAAEHLRTPGRFAGSGAAAASAAQSRHWHHFAVLDEASATADRCVEGNNLVTACRRAARAADADGAVGALVSAWAALRQAGPFRVGSELAVLVDTVPGLTSHHRALAAWVEGSALDMLGQVHDAQRRFAAGLALAIACGDRHCESRLLAAIGAQQVSAGHSEEAHVSLTKALALAREVGDRPLQCHVLNGLGRMADHGARLDEAKAWYESALALARDLRDRRLEGGLLGNLAGLHYDNGKLNDARLMYEQALELVHEVGDKRWEGNARCNLGLVHLQQGRTERARGQFEVALAMAREIGFARLQCTALCNLGIALEIEADLEGARRHYVDALAGARELEDRRSEGQFSGYLGALYARLARFDEAFAQLAAGESLLLEVSDDLSLGLLLCRRAHAEALHGELASARQALLRAIVIADRLGAAPDSELGRSVAGLRSTLPSAD
ncbi:MAG: tetratricopeptide repeat protein [Pseudomonadota bacterium]